MALFFLKLRLCCLAFTATVSNEWQLRITSAASPIACDGGNSLSFIIQRSQATANCERGQYKEWWPLAKRHRVYMYGWPQAEQQRDWLAHWRVNGLELGVSGRVASMVDARRAQQLLSSYSYAAMCDIKNAFKQIRHNILKIDLLNHLTKQRCS